MTYKLQIVDMLSMRYAPTEGLLEPPHRNYRQRDGSSFSHPHHLFGTSKTFLFSKEGTVASIARDFLGLENPSASILEGVRRMVERDMRILDLADLICLVDSQFIPPSAADEEYADAYILWEGVEHLIQTPYLPEEWESRRRELALDMNPNNSRVYHFLANHDTGPASLNSIAMYTGPNEWRPDRDHKEFLAHLGPVDDSQGDGIDPEILRRLYEPIARAEITELGDLVVETDAGFMLSIYHYGKKPEG